MPAWITSILMKPSRKMCSNRYSTCARIQWSPRNWPQVRFRCTVGCMTSSQETFAAAGATAWSSDTSISITRITSQKSPSDLKSQIMLILIKNVNPCSENNIGPAIMYYTQVADQKTNNYTFCG